MNIKYKIETFLFSKLKECILLPSFQRNVVWTEDKKREFIDSVINGMPFGSLLLYRETPERYLLVDGLQRYTTLEEYSKNPANYIKIEQYFKKQIEEIISKLKNKTTANFIEVRSTLIASIKSNFSFSRTTYEIVEMIQKSLPILEADTGCSLLLVSICDEFRRNFDVSTLEIPLICYSGNFDDLPLIFERMNANGTQLSKYDIYAAKWCNIQFEYHDLTILQIIDDKYLNMSENSGIEIHNYTEGQIIKEQKINLFEFCYAFGKQLKKEVPLIFACKNNQYNKSDVDSAGFSLLNVIFLGSNKNMDSLSKLFEKMDDKKVKNLINVKSKILECAKSVSDILAFYTVMPDKHSTSMFKYIESQIICIIATLFKIRYILKVDNFEIIERGGAKKSFEQFQKNMPKRYLYDIIINYWGSSGDMRIADELSKNITENRYLTYVSANQWDKSLSEWMEDQLQKPMKNIPSENKLFLTYLLKINFDVSGVSLRSYSEHPFEFDYIVSKDKFNKKIKGTNGLSSIGNLCILPQYVTKSKHDLTIYEINDSKIREICSNVICDFIYPEQDELSFVKTPDTLNNGNFIRFVKERNRYLINLFKKMIKS